MTQMLETAGKDWKASTINMFEDTKENMLLVNKTGNLRRETEIIK